MTPRILITGQLSSGKSSLLNALAGKIISNVAVTPETFFPETYYLSRKRGHHDEAKIEKTLKKKHNENTINRNGKIDNINIKKRNKGTSLKTRTDLPDFEIIDLPGLNDTNDPENKIYEVIKKKIGKCDLLIQVVRATDQLTRYEQKYITYVHGIIENEKLVNNHYVDYIMVFNKFDNIYDDGLHQFYNAAIKTTQVPINKIFRCSSHKMLVNYIKSKKKKLHIPSHLVAELNKVLDHSNVDMESLKEKRKTTKYIDHADIKFLEIDETDGQTTKPVYKGSHGDWDDIMKYLKNFKKTLKRAMIKLLRGKFNHLIKTHEFCTNHKTELDHIKYDDFCKEFVKYGNVMEKYDIKYDELLGEIINNTLDILPTTEANYFIRSIHSYYKDKYKNLYDTICDHMNILNNETLAYIIYHYRSQEKIIFKKLCTILADKNLWDTNFGANHYNIATGSYQSQYELIEHNNKHRSWFISNLTSQKESVIRKLLRLATIPIAELKVLDREGIIPYDLLDSVGVNISKVFRYNLLTLPHDTKLEHVLFNTEISDNIQKYLENYDELCNTKRQFIVQVTCGLNNTFLLTNDGHVLACGHNDYGQLGLGHFNDTTKFQKVDNINNIKQIYTNSHNTILLTNDNIMMVCGIACDKFGLEYNQEISIFTKAMENIKQVVTYNDSYIALLTTDGEVIVWGQNNFGQLGQGHNTHVPKFVKINGIVDVKQIAMGSDHLVLLKNNGEVMVCGNNNHGQLGVGHSRAINTLQKIIDDVKEIVCYSGTTVVLSNNGDVMFCGQDHTDLFGNSSTFKKIATNIQKIEYTSGSIMLLTNDNNVMVIGSNSCGKYGVGHNNVVDTFQEIDGIKNIKQIAYDGDSTLLLTNNDDVFACGNINYGKLGVARCKFKNINTFQKVISDIKHITYGGNYTVLLTNNGEVMVSGYNAQGYLGLDHKNNVNVFTKVDLF
jgi:alpha-tubulin suppressor-like RCC1 family protein